ncbi:MAG: monovalent cation/H(+) antiporter subunit G [Puniceicoccaceae bacterium]
MMETLVSLLVLAGCGFALIAAIGVVRFPDCYCRLHAATKAGAFGGSLLAVGVGLWFSDPGTWIEVLVLVALFYTTMPVAAHLIARASRRAGIAPAPGTDMDELKKFDQGK